LRRYARVQCLAEGEEEDMRELARAPPPRAADGKAWTADAMYEAIDPYWLAHSEIVVSHEARSPDLFLLEDGEDEEEVGGGGGGGGGGDGDGVGASSGESGFWKVTQKIMVGRTFFVNP
jgi:hypothetical protein